MKKIVALAIPVLLACIHAAAQDGISDAKWQPGKVNIDGQNSEWQKPFNFFDASTGLLFGIANDKDNLYLCFTSKDEMKVRKLLSAGWSIELVSKEKKKKFNSTIQFPAIPPAVQQDKTGGSERDRHWQGTDMATLVNAYKLQLVTVHEDGFTTKKGDVAINDPNGITISVGEDSTQGIVYELAVPLKELYGDEKPQLNEAVTLNVTVNALKAPERAGGFHGGGGGGRGMGGHGMGGGRRMNNGGGYGNGPSGNNAERSALFEKATLTQKFRLVADAK
jgi:hypothetical protein